MTRKTKTYRFITEIVLIITVLLAACEKPKTFEDKELLTRLYSASVDTLTIQSQKYILETHLSRDFFPGGPIPRKSPLIADIYLVNLDSLEIPSTLNIKKLYIIQDQLIWASYPVKGVQPNVPDFKLNKISTDGPKWTPETYVDAIILIVNNITKEEYYLIARDQYIEKTE
jgi:hypothetical protein